MNSFLLFFAQRKNIAFTFTLLIILLGVNSLFEIQRDKLPHVTLDKMVITSVYPSSSPEDVELNVTNKIEKELKSIAGIDYYTSSSIENLSVINVNLEPNLSDIDVVKQNIRDAVNNVSDLPIEMTERPKVFEIKTSLRAIIEIGITGNLPYKKMRQLVDMMEDKLEVIPGVSTINKYGYREREIQIQVSAQALKKYRISLEKIVTAIKQRNIRSTAGHLESYANEKNVVTLAQFKTPQEVGEVVIATTFEGPTILIKDVANIVDSFTKEKTISRLNGEKTLSLKINKKEGADIINTIDLIKDEVDKIKTTLPSGVEFIYTKDESKRIRDRLNIVVNNGFLGLILVILVLGLFLNVKTAFWVGLSIPVSLLGSIFLLYSMGETLNVIVLSGMILVLGIVVDDSIIVAENIHHHQGKGKKKIEAVIDGVKEVYKPVLTTIITTLMAFSPMFFMSGIMGKFVYVIPLVVSCALLLSLAEVTIALPAHLSSKAKHKSKRIHIFKYIEKWFYSLVVKILKLRYIVVVFFISLLIFTIWFVANYSTFVLMPSRGAQRIDVFVEAKLGSSLQASSNLVAKIEKHIMSLPKEEIDSVVTRVGSIQRGSGSSSSIKNMSSINIFLTPSAKRKRSAKQIVKFLKQQTVRDNNLKKITYLIKKNGPPVGKTIDFNLVSANDAQRIGAANSLEKILNNIDGANNIGRNDAAGREQIELKIDYTKLAKLDLSVAKVARNLRIVFDGEIATSVRYGEDDVDFRVLLNEEDRRNKKYIQNIKIPNNSGNLIALKDFTFLRYTIGSPNYNHYNGKRSVNVYGDVDSTKNTSSGVTQDALAKLNVKKNWTEVGINLGGESKERASSMSSLGKTFIIAVVGIYFILFILFGSFWQPLMILSAVPLGIIGVVFSFYLHGESLSFFAMLGVISLSGVVVNDSLVLVNHLNNMMKKKKEGILTTIALGTKHRLRAVILTTLTTVVGVLPLAYGIGGFDHMLAPMCLALGYGMCVATSITLIFLPCLYAIGYDMSQINFKWMHKNKPIISSENRL